MASSPSDEVLMRPTPARLARKGYVLLYRSEVVNFCPACGKSHWIIGRFSAECGFCSTAIALACAPHLGANDR